ncbi:Hypothetical predicted protein [Olea europaea subsp. europaea]|uniref:Uncharacterized protein n=1 Tax=Olea europaea subsp. europaea TaxID=158383 RepID=A0A8S0TCQ9_OLEEU|nr:Hypothetical predicted protein [Olea europaea subsp. europaea]
MAQHRTTIVRQHYEIPSPGDGAASYNLHLCRRHRFPPLKRHCNHAPLRTSAIIARKAVHPTSAQWGSPFNLQRDFPLVVLYGGSFAIVGIVVAMFVEVVVMLMEIVVVVMLMEVLVAVVVAATMVAAVGCVWWCGGFGDDSGDGLLKIVARW